jgi:ubiquinone/menaquinone biosynthesis C-methylase UbiE
MSIDLKPRTAAVNGQLWGARARDWADIQEGMVRPVYEAVLERTHVGSGTRYLDVGCGAGMAAQIAAARGAQVSGIDAADALLAIARARTPAGDFRQGDLEALPFEDHSFDVVTGFNSFQNAGNPAVALDAARGVTKPGGAVVVVTWGDPDGMEAVEVFDVDAPFVHADDATALRGLNASGVAARAMENASEHAVSQAHAQAIAPFRQPDGSYRIAATFRCLLARP